MVPLGTIGLEVVRDLTSYVKYRSATKSPAKSGRHVCVPEMGHTEAVGPARVQTRKGRQQETQEASGSKCPDIAEVQKSCFGLTTGARSWHMKSCMSCGRFKRPQVGSRRRNGALMRPASRQGCYQYRCKALARAGAGKLVVTLLWPRIKSNST